MKKKLSLFKIGLLSLFFVTLVFSSMSLASVQSFIYIVGESSGVITEDSGTESDHQDEPTLWGFGHNIYIPTEAGSGQPLGNRVHRPISIIKESDKCSPLLFSALAQGEKLEQVRIRFYKPDTNGHRVHYFTIELEDAFIVEISSSTSVDSGSNTGFREMVRFTYRKIKWTNEIHGVSHEDDWHTQQ